jgi:starch phosphorylase
VELYADAVSEHDGTVHAAMKQEAAIAGAVNGWVFAVDFPTARPAHHFTPRIVPSHPGAQVPLEASPILWIR